MPSYRHVPGLTPHPVRHPEGHLFGQSMVPWRGEVALPENWSLCPPYLYGIDLFNRAFFWEAHESWEEIWHGVPKASVVGQFVQGLIQCSAALLRRHLDTPRGAQNLFRKATSHFEAVPEGERFMGLDLWPWLPDYRSYLNRNSESFPFLVLDGPRDDH